MMKIHRDDRVEEVDDDTLDTPPRGRAGLRPDENPPGIASPGGAGDIHAVGTPGGGLAAGGLGGTNSGGGSPDGVDLDDAMGAGIHDLSGELEDAGEPYAGPSGGAVGGTPAGKRVAGGTVGGGIAPENDTGADNTIGVNPNKPR